MGLTIDFSMGFVCFDAASKVSAFHDIRLSSTTLCRHGTHLGINTLENNVSDTLL